MEIGPDRELAERLSGAVWGALIGDAVGVPYEFGPPVAEDTVEFGRTGTHGKAPGTWSDDGSMLLALLDSLLTAGFDPKDQADRYLAWADDGAYTPDGEGRFDIGNATAAALDRLRRGVDPGSSGGDGTTLGNGSLMRTLPIALVGLDRSPAALIEQASRASAVTHASDVARATCALYVLVAAAIVRGERDRAAALESAMTALRAANAGDSGTLVTIESWPSREGRGHVVDAFWSAWDAFAGATSYREAITRAIAYGDDTDTTACIAGGLAGAFWGFDRIPNEWQGRMRDRTQIAAMTDRLMKRHGWWTSSSHPLRVDTVDLSGVPGLADAQGTLGMTFLPGKHSHGWSGPWWRDLDEDGVALRTIHGVDVLLLLVEDHELADCDVPDIAERLPRDHDVEVVRFPVPDVDVPTDPIAYREMLTDVLARIRAGKTVAVACRGGLGRTGTAVGCLLVMAGLTPQAAIRLTRDSRDGTIETGEQEDFVRAWS